MAAAEVLAPGSTAAASSDIVVTTPLMLSLKGSGDGIPVGQRAQVIVEMKDEDNLYWPIGQMNGVGDLNFLLEAAATYRVRRIAANTNGAFVAPTAQFVCGVFSG